MKLIISDVSKIYSNGIQALKNINLTIGTGMFGLLGPNGAGKSTLMRTIATLQEPDTGSIIFNGLDVIKQKNEVRKIVGYLPQEFGVYPRITAEELLSHLAVLKGIVNNKERKEIVKALFEQVNLYDVRNKYINSYSGGMKQRFGIAQALLGNPELIIVDEPTAGLDPAERVRFHNLLSEISENIVVILSTHIVEDVTDLCNDMAIIDHGEVIVSCNPTEAIEKLQGKIWSKWINKDEIDSYSQQYTITCSKLNAGKPMIHVLSDNRPNDSFQAEKASLEDVYFNEIN